MEKVNYRDFVAAMSNATDQHLVHVSRFKESEQGAAENVADFLAYLLDCVDGDAHLVALGAAAAIGNYRIERGVEWLPDAFHDALETGLTNSES